MPKKFQFENVPNRLSEKQKIGFLSLFATKKKKSNLHFQKLAEVVYSLFQTHNEEIWYIQN